MYATQKESASLVTARALVEGRGANGSASEHLPVLEEQVCAEAGLWAPDVARRAIGQAGGDIPRAVALLKVWAAALPHVEAEPVADADIRLVRRLSAAYADVPGGQWLGYAPELASRLLEWDDPGRERAARDGADDGDAPTDAEGDHLPDDEAAPGAAGAASLSTVAAQRDAPSRAGTPRVRTLLSDVPVASTPQDGPGEDPALSTPVAPFSRATRLGVLARGETASLVTLAALVLAGRREAVLAELTTAAVTVRIAHPRTAEPCAVAEVPVVEADAVVDSEVAGRPGFVVGWGASLGSIERRAISLALLDAAMQSEGGLEVPLTLDEQTVTAATDGSANNGFVEHLRLPHYASFASATTQARAHSGGDAA